MAISIQVIPGQQKIRFYDTVTDDDISVLNFISPDLYITNSSGSIVIGELDQDIYIGDGINNIDIVFEQDGSIRALTGKILTLGQSDSYINITGSLSGYLRSNDYLSGIFGSGFEINDSYLEIDNITVRNTLRTHIFQKDVVKASNGILYISDSGVITAYTGTTGVGTVTFRDDKSAIFSSFPVTMWFKDINPSDGTISSVTFTLDSLNTSGGIGDTAYHTYNVTATGGSNLTNLNIGGTAVKTSGGTVLLDASSTNSPYIDVVNNGTTLVRTGNIAGITSTKFGILSGYGFWASGSAYLEGSINADGGSIAGWDIGSSAISKNNTTLDSSGYLNLGTGNDIVKLSSIDATYRIWAGNATATSAPFRVTKTGALTATNATITGNITATSGTFTGTINATDGTFSGYVSAGNVKLGVGANGSTGDGLYIDTNNYIIDTAGAITWKFGGSTNYISGNESTIAIKTTSFQLDSTYFDVASDGTIAATAGKIGGWGINSTTISSNGISLVSGSTAANSSIRLGSATAFTTGTGIWLDGSGNFRAGTTTGNRIVWDGSNILISSSNAQITGSSGWLGSSTMFGWSGTTITAAGWTIGTSTISKNNVTLDSAGKISINSATWGSDGIQLEYNGGNPRAYIGNGSTRYFNFDGTNISWNGGASSLNTAGKLITTSAEIGGWTIDENSIKKVSTYDIVLDSANEAIYIGAGNYNSGSTSFFVSSSGILSIGDTLTYDGTDLTLTGTVYATAGSFTGNISATSGNIGNWNIVNGELAYGTDIILDATNKYISINNGEMKFGYGISGSSNHGIYINNGNKWISTTGEFHVSGSNGSLYFDGDNLTLSGSIYAGNGTFSGTINATSGSVGGFTISNTEGLYSGTGNTRVQMKPGYGFWAGETASSSAEFWVNANGDLKATNVNITGSINATSGFIGGSTGWQIESNLIKNIGDARIKLYSNGTVYNSITMGTAYNHTSGSRGIQLIYDVAQEEFKFYIGNENISTSSASFLKFYTNENYVSASNLAIMGNSVLYGELSAIGDISFSNNFKLKSVSADQIGIGYSGSGEWGGSIFITDNGAIYLRSNFSTNLLAAGPARTSLFLNGKEKLYTTTDGITVIGYVSGSSGFKVGTTTIINSSGEWIGNNIDVGDNVYIKLGLGDDLKLYHDGSHSYINNSTGKLYIENPSNSIIIGNKDDFWLDISYNGLIFNQEASRTIVAGSGVELYYNGSLRIKTSATGANIYGNLSVSENVTSDNGLFYMGGTSSHGIIYMDTGSVNRYAMIINNDIVALTNTAPSGSVMIRANNSASGGSQYEQRMIGVMPYNNFIGFYKSGSNKYNDTENSTQGHWRFLMQEDGDFHADGDVYAYSSTTSDIRLKKDIINLDNSIDKILQLNGVYFKWKNKNDGTHVGLIAQDVQKVLPEIVHDGVSLHLVGEDENPKDYISFRSEELIPLLVEGIKDQQSIINKQNEKINNLENKLSNLERKINKILRKL